MAYLFHSGAGLDRIYYGTDTRMSELLVGGLLAVVLHRLGTEFSPSVGRILGIAGALAYAVSLWAMAVVGLFLIVGLISIANRLYNDYAYPPAVVVAEQVSVMSGPGGADQYVVEFDLHTGAEVTQLESHDNWRRVSLPGHDFQGWVSADALELVNLN